ncbi:MAG: HAD family phosphatase [Candidatus Marinimicrobia bacterium]|nr:HAD family phosphatase [Candidatus Neomarinimicrobiota bacterium]
MPANKAEITTIFLDIGGVLLELNLEPLLAEITRATGLSPRELWGGQNHNAYHALERGEIGFEEYYRQVFGPAGSGRQLPLEDFKELWLAVLGRPTPVLDLLPTLLRQAKVFLLSNSNEVHFSRLYSDHDFMEQVDGVIGSHLVGHRKPEREIFELALRKAGVRPEQALFVDDFVENVAAAQAMGIRAHHYRDDIDALRIFLRKYGLHLPA